MKPRIEHFAQPHRKLLSLCERLKPLPATLHNSPSVVVPTEDMHQLTALAENLYFEAEGMYRVIPLLRQQCDDTEALWQRANFHFFVALVSCIAFATALAVVLVTGWRL
jgi:hypothetical protein